MHASAGPDQLITRSQETDRLENVILPGVRSISAIEEIWTWNEKDFTLPRDDLYFCTAIATRFCSVTIKADNESTRHLSSADIDIDINTVQKESR
jgi:hypothetical protein